MRVGWHHPSSMAHLHVLGERPGLPSQLGIVHVFLGGALPVWHLRIKREFGGGAMSPTTTLIFSVPQHRALKSTHRSGSLHVLQFGRQHHVQRSVQTVTVARNFSLYLSRDERQHHRGLVLRWVHLRPMNKNARIFRRSAPQRALFCPTSFTAGVEHAGLGRGPRRSPPCRLAISPPWAHIMST